MSDPLTDIVQLLDPSADFSKVVEASGPWLVRRSEKGRPFFCVVLGGASRLEVDGVAQKDLQPGDFLMIPEAQDFSMSAADVASCDVEEMQPVQQADGHFRLGPTDQPVSTRLLIGYCRFRSPDATLLLSLLPRVIHVRDEPRLTLLVQIITDETMAARPGRNIIVARLLEVTLIEALRTMSTTRAPSGLLRGLADARLSPAIHLMHEDPARPTTIKDLAKVAGLSRTVFFERFKSVVGLSPMEQMTVWRMAIAKRMLRENRSIHEVARVVGYGSTSSFATAFKRYAGISPARFAAALR